MNQAIKITDDKKIVLQKLKKSQPKRLFKLPTLAAEVSERNNKSNHNMDKDRQSIDLNGKSVKKQEEKIVQ